MKKIFTAFLLIFTTLTAHAQGLPEAEKLYQDGDFASALPQYQQILKSAVGDTLYQAQLRAAACQYSQGEYLTAAQTLFDYPLPENPVWKARFLLYRIQFARQVSNQYRRILQTRALENNTDKSQWTRQEWQAQMEQDFEQLWALRANLINAPIEKETLLLNLQDTDVQRIPTLFDFSVHEWTEFLTDTNVPVSAPAHTYLDGQALAFPTTKSRADKLADILQTAYLLEGTGRQNARLFWKTDLILLPFTYPQFFEISDKSRALEQAITQLNNISGYQQTTRWWKKLKNYLSPDATLYGRSYAAYQAADHLYGQDQREPALNVCKFALKELGNSYYTRQCQQLIDQITRPELSFNNLPQALHPQHPQLTLTTRNIPQVYARIYPLTKDQLEKFYHAGSSNRTLNDWSNLVHLSQEAIQSLLKQTNYQTAQQAITYQKPYFSQEDTLLLPALPNGLYAVLISQQASFDPKEAPVTGQVINLTDLALFVTAAIEDNPDRYVWTLNAKPHTYTPPVFHIYTLNLKTGQPEPNTALDIITAWKGTHEKTHTNAQGVAQLARSVIVNENANNSHFVDIWAEQGSSAAFSPRAHYFHFYNTRPVRLFAQTDRAIYRPGQKVHVSVQAFESTPRGPVVLPSKSVQLRVRGANGKQIFQSAVTLNAFGTAQTQFTLPEQEALLGDYSLDISCQIGNEKYQVYHSFEVEEYKRPEYKISLDEPTTPLAYAQAATIPGKAAYYTGTPLQEATVKYSVTRREYIPPFYWWRSVSTQGNTLVTDGETKTNAQGQFSVSFTPTLQRPGETAAQYTVWAEVYDATGRATQTTRTYRVSQYPRLFKLVFTQGFYDANTPTELAELTLTDADGHPITGAVTVRLARVKDTPANSGTTLDQWYEKAPVQEKISSQVLTFNKPEPKTLDLPALPEGIYRLTLRAEQAEEQSVIFVVASPKPALQLPAVILPQHTTYYPGQTARLLLGAGTLSGSKRVETFFKRDFLRTSELLPGGLSIYEYPVTANDRGGLAITWFGASDYTFYHANTTLTVPFDNQELTVQINNPTVAKPGQTVRWNITARNAQQAPVNGQASLTVYDKSLDYYAQKENPFTLKNLFPQTAAAAELSFSRLTGPSSSLFTGKESHTWEAAPQLPSLNLVMQRAFYEIKRSLGSRAAENMLMMAKAPMAARSAAVDTAAMEEYTADLAAPQSLEPEPLPSEDSALRTDFAETAYFNTLLPLTNGTAQAAFKLPQSVTTWNVLGYVLTKDAQLGTFTASTITRKDFMVRLHLPRFYREGDKGLLQVSVDNLTNRKLTVPVTLSLTQDGQDKAADFGLKTLTKNVTVPANATAFAQWEITAPAAPGLYQITAVARKGNEADGEQKTLPLLPSLSRLLAATHVALHNGNNTLQLTELDDVSDANPQLAALTLTPSLALAVLNKMPNLLSTPYNDLISSLNRYIPLAIVNQFYTTYPALKQAVKKLPARTGLTAPWDETDPLRLTLLEQTPWLTLAQGSSVQNAQIISLFDDKLVSAKLTQEKERLLKFQNANGSFSWFAGGPEDAYLTLRVLDAYSQAISFGADIPQESAEKALSFVVPYIEKQLKADKSGSVATVSLALYAAYTLSAFPAHWSQVSAARPYLQKWVDYAGNQSRFMTPLGQTYAAAVYHRLGDDLKANAYLDKVLARLKYNELTGAYFAPEAQSWVWYQDTISTQTATLKTLLEIRPDSDKIAPLVQWLLFNKQVTGWTNPAAAAKAVFALLDVMHTQGALSSPATYQVDWANTHETRTFQPLDWTDKLQWVQSGAQLTPAVYRAHIHKQSKMTDFASLNVIYTTAQAKASPKGVLNVTREYFVRFTQDGTQKLRPVKNLDEVTVGDEVEVQLTLTSDSAFEYVLLSDPKPAGFESADLTSGWTWNPVAMYREVRDAETNYFIHRLPAGTMRVSYVLRPTVPGQFHAKPAQVQSMYAPQFGAHSSSEKLHVEK